MPLKSWGRDIWYLRTLADAGAVILAPTCGVDANEALKKATGSYGRFREAVSTIDPRKE